MSAEAMSAEVLLLCLVPCVVLMISGATAMLFTIKKQVASALEHFAAGVVISAMCTELVPKLQEPDETGVKPSLVAIIIGFSAGVALLLTCRQLFPEDEEEDGEDSTPYRAPAGGPSANIPWGSMAAYFCDLFIDGGLTGMAFATGGGAGMIIMLSIALEMASFGSTAVVTVRNKGCSNKQAFLAAGALASTLFVGAVLALTFMSILAGTPTYYGLLSFGIAAMLWLVVEDLMKEAHEKTGDDEPKWITVMFFLGFLLPIILDRFE